MDPKKPIGDPLRAHIPGQRLVIEPIFLITKALERVLVSEQFKRILNPPKNRDGKDISTVMKDNDWSLSSSPSIF